MKKIYKEPEMEVTETFTDGQFLKQGSEPEGGGWVGGNTGNFDEAEAMPTEAPEQKSLWDD